MKRQAFALAVLLGLAAVGSAQTLADPAPGAPRFSIRLGGGAAYATLGDLGLGIAGQESYLRDEYGELDGSYETPKLGSSFGGELLYALSPRFSLGLGAGYARHAKASQVTYAIGFIDVRERINPRLTLIPLELNLHMAIPLGRSFAFDLFAGPGYYWASFDYEFRMDLDLLGMSGYDVYTFKSRRGTVGFQAGLGFEVALGSRLALVLNAVGRYARLSDFQGDWTEEGGGDFWEYSDSGDGDAMWYYGWTYEDKKYDQVAFQAEKPFGSLVSDVRPARIDLTGIAVFLSLKIRLF